MYKDPVGSTTPVGMMGSRRGGEGNTTGGVHITNRSMQEGKGREQKRENWEKLLHNNSDNSNDDDDK